MDQLVQETFIDKLRWNLPWLTRYPLNRVKAMLGTQLFERKRLIVSVANHFEPGWAPNEILDRKTQAARLKEYVKTARDIGDSVRDSDGTKFRHTNFYPAEQYDAELLDMMADMQAEGLGEVEVHLHHGVARPDNADDLRAMLSEFRDILAQRHQCLSVEAGSDQPRYAFVHGNLALANSCNGKYCGVDNEMAILRDTGCYADMTMPSAPDKTQVPMINSIYEYTGDPECAVPHRKGRRVGVREGRPQLPLMITGPLVFEWIDPARGYPRPRIDDGSLTAALGHDMSRIRRWQSAGITVDGRSDWVFIKLYCHGFFDDDQSACIGEDAKRFFGQMVEDGERTGRYTTHFVSAREMYNLAMAAIDGKSGDPNEYRDHLLTPIMRKAAMKV